MLNTYRNITILMFLKALKSKAEHILSGLLGTKYTDFVLDHSKYHRLKKPIGSP